MIKKVLSIFLSLSIIALCPLTAFAMVATPSDAVKVPVASSNEVEIIQSEADRTNTEDMIAAEESNTTNIINNNNANTDKLAYGYDSSAQDQKNDELGSKLDEYDSAESEIFDSVSGNISDFNMDDYKIEDSSLLAGIVWVSDFMQQLFVSMGLFNLPVTISLVLIFVVIMIGYYRIRS